MTQMNGPPVVIPCTEEGAHVAAVGSLEEFFFAASFGCRSAVHVGGRRFDQGGKAEKHQIRDG